MSKRKSEKNESYETGSDQELQSLNPKPKEPEIVKTKRPPNRFKFTNFEIVVALTLVLIQQCYHFGVVLQKN